MPQKKIKISAGRKHCRSVFIVFCLLGALQIQGCSSFVVHFLARSVGQLPFSPDSVSGKKENPVLPDAGLSVLWAGHSTCLIQIGSKVFCTDPMFSLTAGMVSKRKIESGLLPESISRVDYILISHLHFDHLNYSSLAALPQSAAVVLPPGGLEYMPEFGFSEYYELSPWTCIDSGGVRITAVPVKHFNGRYGFDGPFIRKNTFTGYIIEYQGRKVFFAGDTGYDPEIFLEIGKRYSIDLALIPIAPIEPRDFMKRVHADPEEALQIFTDTRARMMIPIHHRTFEQGMDSLLTTAGDQLRTLAAGRKLEDRVFILRIGEQRIVIP